MIAAPPVLMEHELPRNQDSPTCTLMEPDEFPQKQDSPSCLSAEPGLPTDVSRCYRSNRVIAKSYVQFEEYHGEEVKFLICLHSYQKSRKRYCVCDSMYDGSKLWSYDVCHEWFHPECLGYSSTESAPDPFMCQSCLSKMPMRKTGGKSMETKKSTDKKVLIV